MAVVITIKLDGTNAAQAPQLLAPVTAALEGIQAKMKQVQGGTTTATQQMITGLQGLASETARTLISFNDGLNRTQQTLQSILPAWNRVTGAYREAVGAIHAAIAAQTAYAQSLSSIQDAAKQASIGLKPISGVFRESVASIQAAITANSAYAQSVSSIARAAQDASLGLKPLTGVFRESVASIHAATQANNAYSQSLRSIATAAQAAARVQSPSILSGARLGGAGAESVRSLQEAIRQGAVYAQSIASITAASQRFAAQSTATATTVDASSKKVTQSILPSVDAFALLQRTIRQTQVILAAFGLSTGVGQIAKDMLQTAGAFELLDLRLQFLTKDMAEFDQAKSFVLDFAKTTQLTLDEVSDAFVRLRATGLDAQKILPTIVDAVSAFGGSNVQIERLVYNIQQMAVQAKVSAQELRDIARGSLIPAEQLIKEQAQKAGKVVADSLAEAGVSGIEAINLMISGMQEHYKGATIILSGSFTVLMSNMIDQWKIFSDTIVRESGFLDFLKGGFLAILDQMTLLTTEGKVQIRELGQTVIEWVASTLKGIADILDWLALLYAALEKIRLAIVAIEKALQDWQARMGAFVKQDVQNLLQFLGVMEKTTATGAFTKNLQEGKITLEEYQKLLTSNRTELEQFAVVLERGAKTQGTFDTAQQKSTETVKDSSTAIKEWAASILGVDPTPFTSRLSAGLDEANRKMEEANRKRDQILGELRGKQKPFEVPTVVDEGAAQAAVEEAKGIVRRLDARLKREEFMIQQSFDERRRLADNAASEALAADTTQVKAIAATRRDTMRTIALQEAELLKTTRLASLEESTQAEVAAAQAAITAAGTKAKALARAQEQMKDVEADAAVERAKILKQYTDVEQQVTKQSFDQQVQAAQQLTTAMGQAQQQRLQAAVERAQAEVQRLESSLTQEEQMIQQSFDERRQMADHEAATALAAEGANLDAIAATRTRLLRELALKEAQELETARLAHLTQRVDAEKSVAQAMLAAAGDNAKKRAEAEAALTAVTQMESEKRATITKQRTDVEQQLSKKSVQEQLKDAQQLNKLLEGLAQDQIQARIDLTDEQIALVQAQVDGNVLTWQEGLERIHDLQLARIADSEELARREADVSIRALKAEVLAAEERGEDMVQIKKTTAAQIAAIEADLVTQTTALNLQAQTETQRFLNEQAQEYERFADTIRRPLERMVADLLNGTLSVIDTFKRLAIDAIAQIVAYAASQTIVIPIITTLLGGGGGAAGGIAGFFKAVFGITIPTGTAPGTTGIGTTGSGLGAAEGLGLLASLKTLMDGFGQGLSGMMGSMAAMVDRMLEWTGLIANQQALYESALVETGAGITPAGTVGVGTTVVGVAGGLLALAGGIYGALNATNDFSKAAYAAAAAAGTFAAGTAVAGYLMGAAVTTAGGTGWTGIGLIVAAALAAIATVLEFAIKPEGPVLGVKAGTPGGDFRIAAEDEKLHVRGDLGSTVTRREGFSKDMASGVQAALEQAITTGVQVMIDAINAVALHPEQLLGEAQSALTRAINDAAVINTGNAKKASKDIAAQLQFVNTQVISFFLNPLISALGQLEKGTLEEQLTRLAPSIAGMVAVFRDMNRQLEELSQVTNTDVLRQLSAVRNRVEDFGAKLADTARVISSSLVDQSMAKLEKDMAKLVDLPLKERIVEFAGVFLDSIRALAVLRETGRQLTDVGLPAQGVTDQWTRLAEDVMTQAGTISEEIVTAALADMQDVIAQMGAVSVETQASLVNSLFDDSVSALYSLWSVWRQLESQGVDFMPVVDEFNRLWFGVVSHLDTLIRSTFNTGTFSEFLRVVLAIPPELAAMSEELTKLRNTAQAFANVMGPIEQAIQGFEAALETPADVMARTAGRMDELRGAIARAGDDVNAALPLYAQLGQAVIANAQAQIAQIQAIGAVIDRIKAIQVAQLGPEAKLADVGIEIVRERARTGSKATPEDLAKLVDLYAEQLQLVQQLMSQIESILTDIDAIQFAQLSPEAQVTNLQSQIAPLQAIANTGKATVEQLGELTSLYSQQLQVVQAIIAQIEGLITEIDAIQAAQLGPEAQLAQIQAQIAPLQAIAESGTVTVEQLGELTGLYTQQLQLVQEIIAQIETLIDSIEQTLNAQLTATERLAQLLTEFNATTTSMGQAFEQATALEGIQPVPEPPPPFEGIQPVPPPFEGIQPVPEIPPIVGIQPVPPPFEGIQPVPVAPPPIEGIQPVPELPPIPDVPPIVPPPVDLGPTIEELSKQVTLTQELIGVIDELLGAIASALDSIEQTLLSQLSVAEQFAAKQAELTALTATGDRSPETLIEMAGLLQEMLALQEQTIAVLESTLESAQQTISQGRAPSNAIAQTQAEIAALTPTALAGTATPEQMAELVALNQELLALGEQTNNLALQAQALTNLEQLVPILEDQLQAAKDVQQAIIDTLTSLQTELQIWQDALVAMKDELIVYLTGIKTVLDTYLAHYVSVEEQTLASLTDIEALLAAQLGDYRAIETAILVALGDLAILLGSYMAYYATVEAKTLAELQAMRVSLEHQLLSLYGTLNIQEAIRKVQVDALAKLKDIEKGLKDLFEAQKLTNDILKIPAPASLPTNAATNTELEAVNATTERVVKSVEAVTSRGAEVALNTRVVYMVGAQMGGYVGHYAAGGMVSTLLEPGERVFTPPVPAWVPMMNDAIPRHDGGGWTVPGIGDGDRVPAMLPPGSFVMNRNASRAMGYQQGGTVSPTGTGATPQGREVIINVDLRGAHFSNAEDLERLKRMLIELRRRGLQP